MSVSQRHPALSAERLAEWQLMRDAMGGESDMKARGETYLPKPGGFKNNPATEAALYDAYRLRAMFPEILAPSVSAMIGIIHGQEIKIEIPTAMEFLWENADGLGLPLEAFHRRITRELLVIGGYGVLADAPVSGGNPFLAGFTRDSIINWDAEWWVLDETGMRRDGFIWKQIEKYRVLGLGDGAYLQSVFEGKAEQGQEIIVKGRGGNVLPRIPFAVASARDLSPKVETPPLIGVARAGLAIYQLSADYRWQLYMSGQETLVAINGSAPAMIGAGVVHQMNGAEGMTPDLKYVSPSCSGIEAHLKAIEDARIAAVQAGARLLEQSDAVQESGEARKLRFASETATLTSVAQNSCALLERALRNIAMIMGLPEDDIVVNAPSDLLDRTMTPTDAEALMRVWQGGGMPWEDYHAALQRGGLVSSERDADEAAKLIDDQAEDDPDPMGQPTERNRADGTQSPT